MNCQTRSRRATAAEEAEARVQLLKQHSHTPHTQIGLQELPSGLIVHDGCVARLGGASGGWRSETQSGGGQTPEIPGATGRTFLSLLNQSLSACGLCLIKADKRQACLYMIISNCSYFSLLEKRGELYEIGNCTSDGWSEESGGSGVTRFTP